jgi:hypothetical protein
MFWFIFRAKHLGQTFLNIPGAQFSAHPNRRTLPGELVDDIKHPKWPSIIGGIK